MSSDREGLTLNLTREEIIRELRRYQHDPEWRGKKRVPIAVLAEYLGLHRQTLYDIAGKHRRIGKGSIVKVSAAILAIREGKLRFAKKGQQWVPITDTFAEKPKINYEGQSQGTPDAKPHLALLEQKLRNRLQQ
jgi:hypothetical protein